MKAAFSLLPTSDIQLLIVVSFISQIPGNSQSHSLDALSASFLWFLYQYQFSDSPLKFLYQYQLCAEFVQVSHDDSLHEGAGERRLSADFASTVHWGGSGGECRGRGDRRGGREGGGGVLICCLS